MPIGGQRLHLVPLGIPRVALTRAVRRGQLERVGRGLYGRVARPVSAHGTLAEVAGAFPRVSCACCRRCAFMT